MTETKPEITKKETKGAKAGSNGARKKLPLKQGRKTFFLILGILIFTGASVIAAQLIVGYLMLFILGRETFVQTVPSAIYSLLSYALALFFVLFVSTRVKTKWKLIDIFGETKQKKLNLDELGLKSGPTWTDIGLAPVGYIASLILAAGLVGLFSIFPWFNAEEAQEIGFSAYLSGPDRIIVFLILVVIAPIFEEIIFRGFLYGKIRERLNGEVAEISGIIISSLLVSILFGIIHLQWNVGVNVFALSIVLCALREITGTIYAGILTHMIKNGVAFYLIYVLGLS
ncbi:CPBP family intramembrane metalloprotease [Candidatus Saccharibacteria bacterium]|nr:CPBP family intramembrane metalloprotease [Candidatus Saccharibacteria bacterium]